MSSRPFTASTWFVVLAVSLPGFAAELDERPTRPGEWGYRPTDGTTVAVNPPGFVWRPQRKIAAWQLEVANDRKFAKVTYRADDIAWNVHCPSKTFPAGDYVWRYRGVDAKGVKTPWSQVRAFSVPAECLEMPLPGREELLARIPASHPRLFLRPEDLPRLRKLAQADLKPQYEQLKKTCDRLLKNPPPTEEPPTYGDIERKGEKWREIWWGNRVYTIKALNGAATLAFTRLLDGNDDYGRLARKILMQCAEWDPKGATGYRYNDEAGMPYAYYFSRTYTYLYDLLSEEERQKCREVMRIRGEEMFKHLCPRHLWNPYASHSNRAWHYLGELGIAFHGEIPEADDWLWFAANVFQNVYPVWCDDDGGWHEGTLYWSSYIGRFTWWADVMRSALGIDAFCRPYFSQVGYYPMYLMPPNKLGGGFGDCNGGARSSRLVPLVSQLAAQSGNGHWQWYVEQMGGPKGEGGYIGFLRGALPKVKAKSIDELPTSRLFAGTGQAYLNTTLKDAANDVQLVFKSSPFGTQSHGYEANNSFLLWAYGENLLIRSGRRDIYGSDHHKNWMWSTRSVNNITVDGQGQVPHSAASQGRIVAFRTTPKVDVVVGEAADAYRVKEGKNERHLLDRFTRAVIFVKPELIVIYDQLAAPQPSTFTYGLHANEPFDVRQQGDVNLAVNKVGCKISFLAPEELKFEQTDQCDPNPRPRVKLREFHLTASAPEKVKNVEFVTLYRPHRKGGAVPEEASLKRTNDGYVLSARLIDGDAVIELPVGDGKIRVQQTDAEGKAAAPLVVSTK